MSRRQVSNSLEADVVGGFEGGKEHNMFQLFTPAKTMCFSPVFDVFFNVMFCTVLVYAHLDDAMQLLLL